SGCISATFAIEAGNDRIRNEILKRNMSRDEIINCAKLLKKHKIRFITENILANPTSTLEVDIKTLDLNLICRPDYPTVSLLQPYPKTEIFNIALKNDQFKKGDIDGIESFFKSSSLKIPNKKERVNLQRLFAIVIAFPFLRRFLNFLIRRKRLTPLYTLFYSAWRPYCLITKIMPHRLSPREIFWLARRYLTD
ncbi:hypothetical protein KKD72_01935, partial [Patescibacteria group bacterium]|nr:hypothetical protein [Patescibacteria group bacterium]